MSKQKAGEPPSYVRTPAAGFLASLPVDRQLYRQDLAGSLAHVEMLRKTGLMTAEEAKDLAHGLRSIRAEIEAGTFPWREDLEDVHTNIEVRLTGLVGPAGAKVHTARSRNDQIALDERLFLREAIHDVQRGILRVQEALLAQAEPHTETILPGYTHLQRAQPISLAHHLLAHVWRLSRDFDRLTECFRRANVSPLGAGALAGSTLPVDPAYVAHRLGFEAPFQNSLDAVSDRDHLAEFLFDLSLLAVHLSGFGEELVLWSSSEFGFMRPTAELGSGSSLMPQKRNPDVAELARSKAARVAGDLASLLSTLKSLPLAYNRDLQEDKAPLFDAFQHATETLAALRAAVPSLRFDIERMAAAADDPRLLATDLADYLVAKGVPFREAHETVARYFATHERADAKSLRAFSSRFAEDVAGVLDVHSSLQRRATPGGPAPQAVAVQLAKVRDRLERERAMLAKHEKVVRVIDDMLAEETE